MILSVGSLGQRVVIEPEWIPDSARGILIEKLYRFESVLVMLLLLFTATTDYSPPPTNFVFEVGNTRSCIDIIIRSDNIFESTEEFRGQATTTTTGVSINPSETTIEITDINGN